MGWYYQWTVRSAGHSFEWGRDLNGYYDYLGRAFAKGNLYLPIQPAPQLLAAANPWDPAANNEYKMHDMALYGGRYYLYHGAGPALLLFTPWRLITRHDLPENFALFLFCFGGFLFASAALLRLLRLAGCSPGLPTQILLLLGIGLCQAVPYLLTRVWVYEIAIGAGYFCTAGGLFFFLHAIDSKRAPVWFAAAGVMFGLAISCRPHLGVVSALFAGALLFYLARRSGWRGILSSRELSAFVLPVAIIGTAVALYNLSRFGSPFEFGTRYLLAGANQNRVRLASANVLPGLYFFLFCPPDFDVVFPWIRAVLRYPFDSVEYGFPPEYFIEAIMGGLYLAPFAAAFWLVPRRLESPVVRIVLGAVAISAVAVLLFLAATGFTTQRYQVDFLPLAIFAALANLAIFAARSSGWRRVAIHVVLVSTILCGVFVNLTLGVSGPYDEMLKSKPQRYLRIARWFSPNPDLRPVLNPEVEARFSVEFRRSADDIREPLFAMGHRSYRYFLNANQSEGKVKLISLTEGSNIIRDLGPVPARPLDFQVVYRPGTGRVAVAIDGHEVLTHETGTLVTAPVQVKIGQAPRDFSLSVTRFTGRIRQTERRITATSP